MKRILTIISVVLLSVFSVSVVTLAFVKTNFNELPVNNALAIEVFYNQKETGLVEKNDSSSSKKKIYDDVMKLYEQGTSKSVLTSIFQDLYSNAANPTVEKLSNWSWSKAKSANTVFIIFRFDYNNAPYIETNNYNENDVKIQYDTIWLEITQDSEMHMVTAYLRKKADTTSTVSTHRINFLLETSALYNYVLELSDNGLLF